MNRADPTPAEHPQAPPDHMPGPSIAYIQRGSDHDHIFSTPKSHVHEWDRGIHMAEAFGVDGRKYACTICGTPKEAIR